MKNKKMLTVSQTNLINKLKYHKKMLSKYRRDIYFPDDSHDESLDFFLRDFDYNFGYFCEEENLPAPEFLIASYWVPLAIDYDYLPDEEKEEWERKAEEENKNNDELGKHSSFTGYDIWQYEEESFSEFWDVTNKIIEGCNAYLKKLYKKYEDYVPSWTREELEEALYDFYDDCIMNGNYDIKENAEYFCRENKHMKVDERDVLEILRELDKAY